MCVIIGTAVLCVKEMKTTYEVCCKSLYFQLRCFYYSRKVVAGIRIYNYCHEKTSSIDRRSYPAK